MMCVRCRLRAGVAAALVIASGTGAHAGMIMNGATSAGVDTPQGVAARVTINGSPVTTVDVKPDAQDNFDIPITDISVTGLGTGNYSFGGNVDPFQTLGFNFTPIVTTTIVIPLETPITPIFGTASVAGSWGITISNPTGVAGTVTPVAPVPFFVGFDIDDVFVLTPGPALLSYGTGTTTYTFSGATTVPCPAITGCTQMSTLLAFNLTGLQVNYSVTSELRVAMIGEPVTLSVLGLGLIGLGGVLRRRPRAA